MEEWLNDEGKTDIQEIFERYKTEVTIDRPRSYYQNYKNLSCRLPDGKLRNQLLFDLKLVLYSFMLTGKSVIHCDASFCKTFKFGFSRLSTTKQGEIGSILDEPIPILAGFNYFKDNHLFEGTSLLTKLACEAGPLGMAWERCILDNLLAYFEKEVRIKFNLPDVFEGFTSKISIPENNSVFTCEKYSETYTLADFLEEPRSRFFFPEPDAGPDIVFFVEFTNVNEKLRVPVFVQARFSSKFESSEVRKAILTTNPEYFYTDKNGKVKKCNWERKLRIREFLSNTIHLALLVCYSFSLNYSDEKIGSSNQNRYLKIINHSNARSLFSEKEIIFFDNLKGVTENQNLQYPMAKRTRYCDTYNLP